jgi:hypothetical protein
MNDTFFRSGLYQMIDLNHPEVGSTAGSRTGNWTSVVESQDDDRSGDVDTG